MKDLPMLPYETIQESNLSLNNTSLAGEICGLNLEQMQDAFGDPPDIVFADHKSDVEWTMQYTGSDGIIRVFSIYNWCNGPNYDPSYKDLDHVLEWHVGFDMSTPPFVQREFFETLHAYLMHFAPASCTLAPWYGSDSPLRPAHTYPVVKG